MIDLHKLDKFRLKDRERELYGCTGDSGNGVFKVFVGGKSFRVITKQRHGMGARQRFARLCTAQVLPDVGRDVRY